MASFQNLSIKQWITVREKKKLANEYYMRRNKQD